MAQNDPFTLQRAILAAMEAETKRIVEEEAQAASAKVESRVRALAGQIATKVASMVSFETGMNEVVIRVKIER